MEQHIKRKMVLQSMEFFCRTPRPSDHAGHVVTNHCAGVIERKKRVVPSLLELAHSDHTCPPAPVRLMSRFRKKPLQWLRIAVAAIRFDEGSTVNNGMNFSQKPAHPLPSRVWPETVFFPGFLCQSGSRRTKNRELESEDFSRRSINGYGNRNGFAARVFERFHFVNLDVTDRGVTSQG